MQYEIDERVKLIYKSIADTLRRFTSGQLPNAFRILPRLAGWENYLYLTMPEDWTSNAILQATRIFSSNFGSSTTQKFLTLILLPRIRNDIRKNKKLDFNLFQSLRKAIYKPAAFYKGILLPLCKTRTCTLREAAILSSVLRRVSIPAIHSVAVLLSLVEMEYHGTISFFIRAIIEKRYPLPPRVISALVNHFTRFLGESYRLPIMWYQTLLSFVQMYNLAISSKDKVMLKKMSNIQHIGQLGLEIQNRLNYSYSEVSL